MNCFKILLFCFNVFFILAGVALIGIGIWSAVAKVYVSFVIGDALFSAASYMLIGVGVITVSVCITGIIGLRKDNRRWLMVYFCLLIFCFMILVTAAVLAIVFKGEVENVMVKNMRKSMLEGYGMDREITSAWDKLQSELQCCAISETYDNLAHQYNFPYVDNTQPANEKEREKQDSWPIYKRTEFYRRQLGVISTERQYVPMSCCVYDETLKDFKNLKVCQFYPNGPPFNYGLSLGNDYLYYSGCYEKAKQLILDQSDIIVALGFVLAFIMIAGMVMTFLILRAHRDEEVVAKHRREPDHL